MKIKTLKRYQEQAVANGRYHMDHARQQYNDATRCRRRAGVEQRQGIAAHLGCRRRQGGTGPTQLINRHVSLGPQPREAIIEGWKKGL